MSEKTLFQKIGDGEIPAQMVFEDDSCFAFRDINPQAPTHILVCPRKAIPGLDDITESDVELIGHLFLIAKKIAKDEGLERGYRTVFNSGKHGQQTVPHLHLHILGGRQMTWPPG
jgi:histidine triad (HIT) family protein